MQRFKPTKPLATMSKRKSRTKKRARAVKAGQPILNSKTHADAGGIDIGSAELVAAVPADRAAQPVRTFSALTSGVHALRDWLLACGIKRAAGSWCGWSAYQRSRVQGDWRDSQAFAHGVRAQNAVAGSAAGRYMAATGTARPYADWKLLHSCAARSSRRPPITPP
jgi:hypothetical protein